MLRLQACFLLIKVGGNYRARRRVEWQHSFVVQRAVRPRVPATADRAKKRRKLACARPRLHATRVASAFDACLLPSLWRPCNSSGRGVLTAAVVATIVVAAAAADRRRRPPPPTTATSTVAARISARACLVGRPPRQLAGRRASCCARGLGARIATSDVTRRHFCSSCITSVA